MTFKISPGQYYTGTVDLSVYPAPVESGIKPVVFPVKWQPLEISETIKHTNGPGSIKVKKDPVKFNLKRDTFKWININVNPIGLTENFWVLRTEKQKKPAIANLTVEKTCSVK